MRERYHAERELGVVNDVAALEGMPRADGSARAAEAMIVFRLLIGEC